MAKGYTFTDVPQPTSPTATAIAGGSLLANTTYYYRIVKTLGAATTWNGKSLPSDLFSATTTTTDKTIRISFNTTTTGGHYKIFRSTTPDGFMNQYIGPLNFYPTDALYQTAGVVTFDDVGTATLAGNQFCENLDLAHGVLVLSGSTSSDKFTINELYDADITNGWGVIEKLDENTFKVKTYLYMYQQYFTAFEKTIIFCDGIGYPSNWTLGRVTGTNRTYAGCNIIVKSTWLSQLSFFELIAYRSTFLYKFPLLSTGEEITTGLGLTTAGFTSGLIQDCQVDRFRSFVPSNSSCVVNNCIISRFDIALSNSQATFNDLKCLSGSRVWQISGGGINIVGRGVYTEGTSIVLIINAGTSSLTIIDSISDGGILVNSSSTGFKLYDKISYNLNVTDDSGTAIDGASLKVYDKNNTLVVDTTTGVTGSITEQFITRRDKTVSGTTQGSFTDYSPFTIVISKTGYETYTEKVTYSLSLPVVKTFTLKPIVPIRLLAGDGASLALQPELGSSSLLKKV